MLITNSRNLLWLMIILLFSLIYSNQALSVYKPQQATTKANKTSKPQYAEGEVLVRFKAGATEYDAELVERMLDLPKGKKFITKAKTKAKTKIKHSKMQRWRHYKSKKGQTTEELIKALKQSGLVDIAEPNYIVSIQQTPNDPRFAELWGLDNTGQTGGTPDADVDAPEAWASETGTEQIIAVIDTGVDYTHEDLAANMWTNPGEIPNNGIDDDANGYVDDVYGYNFIGTGAIFNGDSDPMDDNSHGTHVAGTIAAVGNNGIGVAGVNWSAKIMALKFLDSTGGGYSSDAVNAIMYATDMGATISNNSWGGSWYSQLLYDAIEAANNAGMIFVAAAGNSGRDNDVFSLLFGRAYPASYDLPNIIAVAASDANDTHALWSNFGATRVDLAAPGVDILSTLPGNTYGSKSGTSMASPHVAGAAALLYGLNPALTHHGVKAALLSTVNPIDSMAGLSVTGGRLNIARAIFAAQYDPQVTPMVQQVTHGDATSFTITVVSSRSDDTTLQFSLAELDAGLSASFSENNLILPANSSVSTTLQVNTSWGMQNGNYTIPVLINNGTVTLKIIATINLGVPRAEISVSQLTEMSKFVLQGDSADLEATVHSIDGYVGAVSLSATVAEPTMSVEVIPASVNLSRGGSQEITVRVTSQSETAESVHAVELTALADGIERSASLLANVRAITVCASGCVFNTIQAAIDAAPQEGYVIVGPGTYPELISLDKTVVVFGAHGAENTIIDGTGLGGSVVSMIKGSVLGGFTVTGGAAASGAGIHVLYRDIDRFDRAKIQNNIIRGNTATSGGGGIALSEGAEVRENLFEFNSAPTGGALAASYLADLGSIIKVNIFRNNEGDQGSALTFGNQYLHTIVEGNLIEQNGSNWAGTVYIGRYTALEFDRNKFLGNYVVLQIDSYARPAIRNSIFANNWLTVKRGDYALPLFDNNTFTGNDYVFNTYISGSGGQVFNNIFWDNGALFRAGQGTSWPLGSWWNLTEDPMFVDAAAGDYRLQAGSPAIDAGVDISDFEYFPAATDYLGVPRPQDGDGLGRITGDGSDYDIGAFEYIRPGQMPVSPNPIGDGYTVNSFSDVSDQLPGDGVCHTGRTPPLGYSVECTLRAAIQESNARAVDGASEPDEILLPPGEFRLSLSGTNEDFAVIGDLDIRGKLVISGDNGNTIINAAELDRAFHVHEGAEVVFNDFRIKNGTAPVMWYPGGHGGGIHNNGNLTLNNMVVENNYAVFEGGGVFNSGTLSVNQSQILNNTGAGGLANLANGYMHVSDSTISGNASGESEYVYIAGMGGGIRSFGDALTVKNSLITDNYARLDGGGLYFGGFATPLLENVTVSGNTAGRYGAGIHARNKADIKSSTIAHNNGVGLYAFNSANSDAIVNLTNNIIASNVGGDCSVPANEPDSGANYASISSLGYNLDTDNSCNLTAIGDQPATDPLLAPLADNGGPTQTHALLSGSPAIGTGAVDCPATDQRGIVRPQDGGGVLSCDTGAYEKD